MSTIRPFKAIHYNIATVGNLKSVVCPPYDVISSEEQAVLLDSSPYNFTHIDFNKDKPGDSDSQNKYTRAKKTFTDWLSKGVMVEDEKPAIYFYKQEYKIMGQKHSRLGFISLMALEDEDESRVRPHEKTHARAVDDRLQLTQALHSNLSSIFVCYSDNRRNVEKIFLKHIFSEQPFLEVEDKDKVRHKVWRLTDMDLIEEINESLSGQQLFIADGHHRYKVACEYRKLRMANKKNAGSDDPSNYVMTYFTNMDSRDLQIFPMHRVICKIGSSMDFIEEYFRVDKIKSQQELLILLAKAGRNEHAFGLYTRDGISLLRLKNKLLINSMIQEGSEHYRNLDATILKYFILDKIGVESEDLVYLKDLNEATGMVDDSRAQAAFIMNPVRIEQLRAVALAGERMPPKSTYFYPKVLSGLTVYKMD